MENNKKMRSIVWFRRDLRVSDNKALYNASVDSDQIIAVYFLTPDQWRKHNDSLKKISFWMEGLLCLQKELQKLNIPLVVYKCKLFRDIPELLNRFAVETNVSRVYFNNEYEYNEVGRDKSVASKLEKNGIQIKSFDDRILIRPGMVITGQGKPYSVFTPFRNNWAKKILNHDVEVLPVPEPLKKNINFEETDLKILKPYLISDVIKMWPAGEKEALRRLEVFIENPVTEYDLNRDIPSINGTSMLSPYLTAGNISPRQCLKAILSLSKDKNTLPDFSNSIGCWLNEIIWRDFYTNVVSEFQRVAKGMAFQLLTDRMEWNYNEEHFTAWKNGLTGYPIVDAAMRQLKVTGWMHNRLRMIVAMFLSKHLFLNWREGEKWFMENLIDGDFAANNGGWQWAASTGTDAAPYFRIFNPYSQSKRFDKNGDFIKRYCPELKAISANALHDPEKLKTQLEANEVDYPEPIVEYSKARLIAIDKFKALKNSVA